MAIATLKPNDVVDPQRRGWQRFSCSVTHTWEDESDSYKENTFVDVSTHNISIYLHTCPQFATRFDLSVVACSRIYFPRIRALGALLFQYPFPISNKDIVIGETKIDIAIDGYFETKFSLEFDQQEIDLVVSRLAIR